jgi:hypothetical protein
MTDQSNPQNRGLVFELSPEGNLVRVRITKFGHEESNELCAGWGSALNLTEAAVKAAKKNYERADFE